MVRQYPHTMEWQEEGTPMTRDSLGFPIAGSPGPTVKAECRYENFQKGGAKEFKNKNGETVFQRGSVFVKKGQPTPKVQDTIKVVNPEGLVVFAGEVLISYSGQLNSTLIV